MPTDEHRRIHPETLRISATYVSFNELFGSIVRYLPANATRLEIADSEVTELNAKYGTWGIAYAAYAEPTGRTSEAIQQVKMEYDTDLAAVQGMQQAVKNNNQIALTAEDHHALGIHIDKKTLTPVPRQEVAPLLEEYRITHHTNFFRANYPDSAGDAHRFLPYGNHLLVQFGYPAAGAEPTEDDFTHVFTATRSRFVIESPDNIAAGTKGYVRACYVNTRGEAGPNSAIVAFIVT